MWNTKVTLDIIFIPIASPVFECKRMYRFLPATPTSNFWSLANLQTATTKINQMTYIQHETQTYDSSVHVSFKFVPASVVKSFFDGLKTINALHPGLYLSSLTSRGQPHYWSSSHAVSQDTTAGSTSKLKQAGAT